MSLRESSDSGVENRVSNMYFESGVKKYFPTLEDYTEDAEARTLSFKVYGTEVEWDPLDALSRLLDTKLINFHSKTINTGYCETCSNSESYVYIVCSGVRYFETDASPEKREIIKGADIEENGN